MTEQTRVGNECFISSELRGGIGESVCSILLILLHGAGLSPLKTLETHWFSADYKYAWKSIHIWQWGSEKLRKTQEESRGPGMFIFIYYSHLFSFSFFPLLHVHILPYVWTHIYTHRHTHRLRHRHTYACTARERERKNMSRSADSPFFSLRPSLWGCAVCNSKCTPLTISQTVYLSFQVHKGGQGAVWDTCSFIHWLPPRSYRENPQYNRVFIKLGEMQTIEQLNNYKSIKDH